MVALGDAKGLQALEFKFHKGIDYQIDPPLQVPTGLKNQEQQFQPGGIFLLRRHESRARGKNGL